jgi:hypothetical protein
MVGRLYITVVRDGDPIEAEPGFVVKITESSIQRTTVS